MAVDTAVERVRYVHQLSSVPQLFTLVTAESPVKGFCSIINEATLQFSGFVCVIKIV